ncbi:MAG TPA: CBS domain-containing protein [Planctomycetota bacterium]|nr:CBS domain-containing protein [Planctomycetota bacterium]
MTVDLKKVRAIEAMNKKLHWAAPTETVRAAAQRMHQLGIRALLVSSSEPDDMPGILTSKDIVNLVAGQDPALLDTARVADIMTRPAICVPGHITLLDCVNLMRMTGVRRVPVLDGTEVVGIVSTSDVFALLLKG